MFSGAIYRPLQKHIATSESQKYQTLRKSLEIPYMGKILRIGKVCGIWVTFGNAGKASVFGSKPIFPKLLPISEFLTVPSIANP